jgi:hypothetical protein
LINNKQGFALWDPLSDKMLKENDFSKANPSPKPKIIL